MATEVKEKIEFDFEELRIEDPMDQPSWQEFTKKVNEFTNGEVDFSKVRTGAGSDVNFGHVTAVTITANEIAANTITSNEIAANTITANEIAADTITANEIQAGTITANEISVNQLSAISADLGSITAGTVTGALIRTSDSGARVILDDTDNTLEVYDSNRRRVRLSNNLIEFWDDNGDRSGDIFATSGDLLINAVTANVVIDADSGDDVRLTVANSNYFIADGGLGRNVSYKSIYPVSDDTYSLGDAAGGSDWSAIAVRGIWENGNWVAELDAASGPQFKQPLGLEVRSGTPGAASNYKGYIYLDTFNYTNVGANNLAFSDGSDWFAVQASTLD